MQRTFSGIHTELVGRNGNEFNDVVTRSTDQINFEDDTRLIAVVVGSLKKPNHSLIPGRAPKNRNTRLAKNQMDSSFTVHSPVCRVKMIRSIHHLILWCLFTSRKGTSGPTNNSNTADYDNRQQDTA
ncbi:MAG: hypothetical protein P8M80_01250 [Pirellulaceae bacterium]|nr:hypothetical protein [Pirellulaceae bacterium]